MIDKVTISLFYKDISNTGSFILFVKCEFLFFKTFTKVEKLVFDKGSINAFCDYFHSISRGKF